MRRFIPFLCLALVLASCISDFYEAQQVSLNIQESKEKKVFLAEYTIENIKCYNNNYKFPFDKVWIEKSWRLTLDSNNKETYKINDSSSNMLIFKLEENKRLDFDNYSHTKWILEDTAGNIAGSINGMVCMSLYKYETCDIPDSMILSIYLTKSQMDINNNLTKLFSFTIYRKG